MKFSFTGTYHIDLEKERARITKCFRSPKYKGARDRQRAILDALEVGDINKVYDLYDALPYCEVQECPEKEYVGMWLSEISDLIIYAKYDMTDKKLILDNPEQSVINLKSNI